jgi:AcrR family transcriptional regulator
MLANEDTRAARREAVVAKILEAAWRLARRDGLAGFNLRDLAAEVGMRAPSLYSYFDSKSALYDGMFAQANREALEVIEFPDPDNFVPTFKRTMRAWTEWALSDPPRYQLLFQRTIPGFEPSAESYALAQELYDRMTKAFASYGITDARAIDLWTAISAGIGSQQLANDPGGDRYVRLLEDAIDMFLAHIGKAKKGRRR